MRHPSSGPTVTLLLLTLLLAGPTVRADVEFSGIIEMGDNSSFGLDDTESRVVKWVKLNGLEFEGWTATSYNGKNQTLTLTNGAKKLVLPLKDAVIKESAPAKIEGTFVIKIGDKTITQPVSLDADVPSVIPLGDGTILKITQRGQPDGNVKYELSVERTPGPDGKPGEVLNAPTMVAGPSMAVTMSIGDDAFSFTPKTAATPAPAAAPAAAPDAPAPIISSPTPDSPPPAPATVAP